MFSTYVISPELEEQIQSSWLLEKYPELRERHLSSHHWETDILYDVVYWPYDVKSFVRQYALSLIWSENLNWQLIWEQTDWRDLFWETKSIVTKKANLTDISLATWYMLPNPEDDDHYGEPKEFEKWELLKFDEYGFRSSLDMIMSLSAYRAREVLKDKKDQYEWVNSKWIRNVITACIHGDTKFYQYDENLPNTIISPYWNQVWFSPRRSIWSMTQVYHSHEPAFFATFLRYAYETWYFEAIMWKDWKKILEYASTLPWALWNYWDAWMESWSDYSNTLFNLGIAIWWSDKMRNTHIHAFAPNYNWKDRKKAFYEFKIWANWELELHNNYTWKIDMTFYPEDCEDLIKWLLHQCAYWHGRTSKNQIIWIIKYMYSQDIQEHANELGGFDLPKFSSKS